MTKLRPLGSEKLEGKEKIQRILDLTYYNTGDKKSKKVINAEYITESPNGVYGIVKEKDGYYVKKGLTESTLDYIGGLFMKNKNRFSSYADALKRLELIKGEENQLQEDTKYVLKVNKPKPKETAPTDVATPPPPQQETNTEPNLPPALSNTNDVQDLPMDNQPTNSGDIPDVNDDTSQNDLNIDDEENDENYLKTIQKLTGKLGEKLRLYDENLEGEDIKYVINSVLSAVDLDKLDETDKEEIVDQFDDEETPDENNGMNNDVEPENNEELDEIDKLDKLISTSFDFNDDDEKPYEEIDETFGKETSKIDICPQCKGTGKVDGDECPLCHGGGVIFKKEVDYDDDNDDKMKKRLTIDDLYDDDDELSGSGFYDDENFDPAYDLLEVDEEYTGEESFGGEDIANFDQNNDVDDIEQNGDTDDVETKEIELDDLTNLISQSVKDTLSNYFE